jgi:hypothetical protein
MDRTDTIREDVTVTLFIVLALWALAVAAAMVEGVFAKLAVEEIVALTLFATGFSLTTYALDNGIHGFVMRHRATTLAALVLDALLVIDGLFAWRQGLGSEALGSFPQPGMLLFVLPLAAVATWAAFARRGATKRVSSRRGKSPGASPAAT